jgi:hypothetical protein
LDTFDWSGLLGNALWVVGLAVFLATLSMAHYQTRAGNDRLVSRLKQPESRLALAAGASLFFVGLLLRSGTWRERGMWALCAVFFIAWAVRSLRDVGVAEEEGG